MTDAARVISPPVTGFVTVQREIRLIYGSGDTVEESRAQAVDALRDQCLRTFPDAEARSVFTWMVDDLATYAATAALLEHVREGPYRDWTIHDGAACTWVEAYGVECPGDVPLTPLP